MTNTRVSRAAVLAGIGAILFGIGGPGREPVSAADLEPHTLQAFERYAGATEARMKADRNRPGHFLYLDSLSPSERRQILATLDDGEVWTEPLDTRDAQGHEIRVPDGMITHWVGAVIFPSTTIDRVLAVLQDFDHYTDFYKPDIVRSKLIDRHDDTFDIFLRIEKKTALASASYDVYAESRYARPDAKHAWSRSSATRIAQLSDAGGADETEKPPGTGSGYLWALNSYWRFEQSDAGVIAEFETIVLSRNIPFFLRWLVRPFVERLARNTLRETIVATRNAVAEPPVTVTRR